MALPTFLMVDDTSTLRRIIRNQLRDIGYTTVDEAEDGVMALAKLRSDPFDVVIADITMPTMDGLTLLKQIRADPMLLKVSVLIVVADVNKDTLIALTQAGVNGYIVKPFTGRSLEEKLAQLFRKLAAEE